jgi:hypothetical protein
MIWSAGPRKGGAVTQVSLKLLYSPPQVALAEATGAGPCGFGRDESALR